MEHNEFPIEFDLEVPDLAGELRQEAEQRLQALSKGHTDLIGASVALDQPAHGKTGFIYQARIVVYMRQENVYSSEKQETIEGALKGALGAIERQVRERRNTHGEPWKRSDLSD
jgi:ribosome-associated translation inhibitor RaiA